MDFQYSEDEKFFANLICNGDVNFLRRNRSKLFDFRDSTIKRKEFNKIRNKIFKKLVKKYGLNCQLILHHDCSKLKKFDVDHIIPLSSNELNKKLRSMKPKNGKKVSSQSFGSNNEDNLILSCSRCNAYKKHRIIMPRNI